MSSQLAFIEISREILNSKNPFSRSNQLGRITASGLVIRNSRALLIFHPYIKEWMQPGGHIDAGETPIDAAIRGGYMRKRGLSVTLLRDI